jgi:hypothetical protein
MGVVVRRGALITTIGVLSTTIGALILAASGGAR